MGEGAPRPCVRHHDRRSKFRAAPLLAFLNVHFHAHSTVAFRDYAGDVVIGQQLTARLANHRAGCLGNFPCTPIGIPGALEVMGGDDRMSDESTLTRRQAVVCPLGRNHGPESRVPETPFQILPRGR